MLDLIACLKRAESQKQLNLDIKEIEKTLNYLKLVATFSKGDTKKELNAYIKQLSSQLSTVKLRAKIDNKNLQHEIDDALKATSFKDIDLLNVDENKTKLKARKVIAGVKSVADKNPITLNVELKKQKLNNDLTAYLNKNSKIGGSGYLLKKSDDVRALINAISDKQSMKEATDAFALFRSEVVATGFAGKSTASRIKDMLSSVTKIGSVFGAASLAVRQYRKSLANLKEIDTYLTEISKANDKLSKSELLRIGNDSFSVASKYGKTVASYLAGVQEMSRAGYENAESMAELSTAAQGAGDMTAALANQYIIATDKAYKMNGSVEELTRTLDGANSISNLNAVNMTELASGMSVVGSQAASSQMEVNETTAAIGTLIAVTQKSGSEMGNAFKGILMNLRQVTGELEDGEDAIDETSLTKYEKACNELGVSLSTVKDGVVSLKRPMQILKELSEQYTKLDESDARRANLLSAVGGKYRANALNALLENYDLYEKMLGDYANGIGSMEREAKKTAGSWEGRLNSLQNSWDSFCNSLTNKDAIMGGVSLLDRLIQGAETLTNMIGEIPMLLTAINAGMTVANKDYGITQVINKDTGKFDIQGNLFGIDITAIKEQKKHFAEAGEAINAWNTQLADGVADINTFDKAVVQNNAQLKAYLATASKDAPASLAGYEASLHAAGITTDTLRLKTILLNAAISMGVGIAIQAAVQGISYLIQRQENLRQATEDSAKELKDSTQAIDDYATKYEELHDALIAAKGDEEQTYEIKKQLLDLQQELNEKYGEECGKIDLVTDAYKNQTDVIKNLKKEKAKLWLADNNDDIERATEHMEKENSYALGFNVSSYSAAGKAIAEIAKKYEDRGVKITPDEASGTYEIKIKANALDADKTIDDFKMDIYDLKEQFKDDPLLDNVLSSSNEASKSVDKILDKWQDIYTQSKMSEIASDDKLSAEFQDAVNAVDAYNEAIAKSSDPFNDADVATAYNNLQNIKSVIQENEAEWGKYSSVTSEVFDRANTGSYEFAKAISGGDTELTEMAKHLEGMSDVDILALNDADDNKIKALADAAEDYGLSIDNVITVLKDLGIVQKEVFKNGVVDTKSPFSKEEMISAINGMSEGFEALDKIMKSQKDKNPFDFSLLDDKKFKDTFSGFKTEYADFIDAITKSPNDVKACQSAYDNLATVWLNSTGILNGLSEENANITKQYLELKGVTNSNAIVENELARIRANSVIEANNLTHATSQEIIAFINESEATDEAREAFGTYVVQKMLAETAIDTSGDISALANVVSSLGLATQAWQRYYAAKQRMAMIAADPNYVAYEEDGSVVSKAEVLAQYAKIAEDSQKEYAADLEKRALLSYGGGNKSNAPSSGGGKGGSDKKNDKTPYYWIEDEIKYLTDLQSKYSQEVDDTNNSYRTQLNYLSEVVELQKKLITDYQKADELYLGDYQRISEGLSQEMRNKIEYGDDSIDYESDEKLKDSKAAWDKYYENHKKTLDAEKELQSLQDSGHTKRVEQLKEQIETAKALGDASYISYGDSGASLAIDFEEINSQISEAKEELKDYEKSWKEVQKDIKEAASDAEIDFNELINDIEEGVLDPSDYEWDQNLRSALTQGVDEYQQLSDANARLTELKTELTTEQKNLANVMGNTSLGYYESVVDLNKQIVDEIKAEVETAKTGWEEAKQSLLEYGETNEDVNASGIIADVMKGNADLSKFEDGDPLKALVESVINSFGRYENFQKDLMDAEMDLEEARKEAYEKAIEYVEAQQNEISQINATIQSEMDLINASGGLIIESTYKEMIRNNESLIDLYEEQLDLIEGRLGEVEEESADYYDLKSQMQEVTQQINKAKQEQAEWNYEIKILPIKRIEKFLTILDAIKENLQGFIDWENTLGIATSKNEIQQMFDLDSERIQKLQEQLEKYKEVLASGEYEYGSDKYNELVENINSVGSAISDAANEQQELNKQLLNIPVDKIGELNEGLQRYQNIVQSQLDEQENAISAITGLLQSQMDQISDQQDEINDNYDEQIELIDDQIDALDKKNDALEVQRKLEQALYDLERAKNQKTTQVIRNGEIQYEAAYDSIRDTQQAVADAQYDKAKYDLETAKENLENLRDIQLEALDAEIDRLDKIKSKYEDICSLIEQAIKEQNATALLGAGWQDKVLSGNDDELYNYIYKLHESTEFQNDSLTKQLESNERIIEQTQIIIDRFNAQELTLEEATAAINNIINLMKDGYTTDEQLSTQLALDQVNSIKEFSQQTSSQIADSMNDLNDYFVVANENNLTIIEVMGTQTEKLEEIRLLDEENKRLYEEMLKKIEEMNKYYETHRYSSSHDGDDWSGGTGVTSSGTITSGMNGGKYEDNRHDKSNSGNGSPSHNDDQDDKHGPGVHHKGILAGYPGSGDKDRLNTLTKASTGDLEPNEKYIKVLDDELVINKDQQKQLIENLSSKYIPVPDDQMPISKVQKERLSEILKTMNYVPDHVLPKTNWDKASTAEPIQHIAFNNYGDLVCPNVRDGDSFAKELNMIFETRMNQTYSKKWF